MLTAMIVAGSPALHAEATIGADDTADTSQTPYARPQRRVDIGGRALNLFCIGSGAPTVVFDSGLSDWSFSWALVQPQVARMTRTCSYDRAGLGYSDATTRPATSANMVDDLHRLLQAGGIAPPYLLVGHSLGGLNAQLFARLHPSDVAGLVLVDAIHADGISHIDARTGGAQTRFWSAQVTHFAQCVKLSLRSTRDAVFRRDCIEPDDARFGHALNAARVHVASRIIFQRAQLNEALNFLKGNEFDQIHAAPQINLRIPIAVLTAQGSIDAIGLEWLSLQRDLAASSSAGTQQTIANTGHYVQLDAPKTVINTIGLLILSYRRY